MPNKIALIEFPQNAATVSKWEHQSELRDVACVKELVNFQTKNGQIHADSVHCPEVHQPKYISSIVLLDSEGNVEQSQTPAMGIRHHPEEGSIVTLTGLCLYAEDLSYYDDEIKTCLNKMNPCKAAQILECCLDDLALLKDDKAGINFMDTSITFRKPDTKFIESRLAVYDSRCLKHKTCGRLNGRRYPLMIR